MFIVLVYLFAALVSGGLSYLVSYAYWNACVRGRLSPGPGSTFATLGGALGSLCFFAYVGPYLFEPTSAFPPFLSSVLAALVGGFTGAVVAIKAKFDENSRKK
ncbi:MAG: hypothetical protein K2W95_28825 [Candidatus Obscuribacterales bacterium]|nr:hypothetical protein [Candidatus Obscuribacterales bacterium]